MRRCLDLYKCSRYDAIPYRDIHCCDHKSCMIRIDLDEFDPNKTDWINEIDIPEEGWDELKNNYEEHFGRKIMRKQDLRDWHVVVTRGNEEFKVQTMTELDHKFLISYKTSCKWSSLEDYNDDLTYCANDFKYKDIMKVYKVHSPIHFSHMLMGMDVDLSAYGIELVWERPAEAKEMTVAEIEEALGYPVKVVK